MSLRMLRYWIFLLLGIEPPGEPYLDNRAMLARRTGVGLFAPPGNSLVDIIRHEWYLLLGLLSLLTAGAWLLHAIIQPQQIYNTKYILAVVYMLYAVGVLTLTHRASREAANWGVSSRLAFSPLEVLNAAFRGHLVFLDLDVVIIPPRWRRRPMDFLDLAGQSPVIQIDPTPPRGTFVKEYPFHLFNGLAPVECEICAHSDPYDTLITMECFTEAQLAEDQDRILPVFHQECLLEAWENSPRTSGLCLHCQRPAVRWHFTYGRLATTRLIEYINWLFARQIPLIWPTFDSVIGVEGDFEVVINAHRQRHYMRALSVVLPAHMILTTIVILSLQCLYMIYSSPAHIAVRTAYLIWAVFTLYHLPFPVGSLHNFRRNTFPLLIPGLADTVNYFFVKDRPAGSPMALSLPAFARRQFLMFSHFSRVMATTGVSVLIRNTSRLVWYVYLTVLLAPLFYVVMRACFFDLVVR